MRERVGVGVEGERERGCWGGGGEMGRGDRVLGWRVRDGEINEG